MKILIYMSMVSLLFISQLYPSQARADRLASGCLEVIDDVGRSLSIVIHQHGNGADVSYSAFVRDTSTFEPVDEFPVEATSARDEEFTTVYRDSQSRFILRASDKWIDKVVVRSERSSFSINDSSEWKSFKRCEPF